MTSAMQTAARRMYETDRLTIPVFIMATAEDRGEATTSLSEARSWQDEGHQVFVACMGEIIGEMVIGQTIGEGGEWGVFLPSEPYGTIYLSKNKEYFWVNMPDHLLARAGAKNV